MQYIFCVILILMAELALGVHFLYFYDSMGKDLENTKLVTTLTSSYGIDPTFTQSVDFAQHRVGTRKMYKHMIGDWLSSEQTCSYIYQIWKMSFLTVIGFIFLCSINVIWVYYMHVFVVQLLWSSAGFRLRSVRVEEAEFGRDWLTLPVDMLSIKWDIEWSSRIHESSSRKCITMPNASSSKY